MDEHQRTEHWNQAMEYLQLSRTTSQYLIAPINVNAGSEFQTHWLLAVVDFEWRTILIYDSAPRFTASYTRLIEEGLQGVVRSVQRSRLLAVRDFAIMHVGSSNCSRQIDGSSCGIHVVAHASELLRKLPLTSMLPDLRFPNESQEIAALRAEYSGQLQAVYDDQVATEERQTSQVQAHQTYAQPAIEAPPQNSVALQRTPTKRHTSPSDPLSPRRLPGVRQSQKQMSLAQVQARSLVNRSLGSPKKRQNAKRESLAGFTAEQKKARKARQQRESTMRKKGNFSDPLASLDSIVQAQTDADLSQSLDVFLTGMTTRQEYLAETSQAKTHLRKEKRRAQLRVKGICFVQRLF
ncbi:hypothetical protein L596_027088 [Steinernema carpocapsae]|uniref:Ubiquitin-like protease family profile domain-containing protein n=1 Tax=Steinernema carpocapsae TaxID=34508 RepID=A0A4U5M3A8_STECR|nr:hypothetical protein L596_027088 [Steinernema carpocapsae]